MYRITRASAYAAEKASISAGTWYFAPIGGFLAALLLLIGGAPMNFGHWIDDPVARSVFEASVCVVLAYVFMFLFWFIRGCVFGVPTGDASFLMKLRRKVNPAIAIAALAALIFAASISYYFWDRSRGPIIWTWNQASPLSFSRSGTDPLVVGGFQIKGRNRSEDPVIVTKALIRLDTAQDIPLSISKNGTPQPIRSQVIKPGDKFFLHSDLSAINPEWSGGQKPFASSFRNEISGFVLIFEYEGGKPYKIRFRQKDIDQYIAEADAAHVPWQPD